MRYLFLLLIVVVSCTSNKELVTNNNAFCFSDSIFHITEDEKTFDVARYGGRLWDGSITVIDDENFEKRLFRTKKYFLSIHLDKNNNISKVIRYYLSSGNIKKISYSYDSTEIGIETHYAEDGTIIKRIDHEEGYNICWQEALEILKRKERRNIKRFNVTSFYLHRGNLEEFPDQKRRWFASIEVNSKDKPYASEVEAYKAYSKFLKFKDKNGTKRYEIDGKTGKIIGTYNVRYVHL